MTQYNAVGTRGDLYAIKQSDGSIVRPAWDPANAQWSTTLGVAATGYMFPLGPEQGPMPSETGFLSICMKWVAAVAGTATIEVTNFPATFLGSSQGAPDVSDFDIGVGNWQLYNPTLAGAVFAAAVGTGNSMTAYTLTLGGTNAGGAIWNIPEIGFKRVRLKIITTVGGAVRVSANGKLGS